MKFKRIILSALLFATCVVSPAALARFPHGASNSGLTSFATTKVGAGGWLVGMGIAPDGTKVARADSYGGYWYNPATTNCGNANRTGCWQQLVTSDSMPAADQFLDTGQNRGALELRAANTSHFYMLWSPNEHDVYFYSSTNHGATWTKSAGFTSFVGDANGAYRMNGYFIAIDPANENIVYVGTPSSGVFVTTDGGTTFGTALTTPGTANGQWSEPAFDSSAGTVTGASCPNSVSVCTKNVVICTNGTGVYRSTNAGSAWSLLNTAGMPTSCAHTKVDQNGLIWIAIGGAQQGTGGSASISFYKAGAWNSVATGLTLFVQSMAVDPSNGNHVIVINTGGSLSVSYDQGATWTFLGVNQTRSATDIPWLQNTNEASLSAGDIIYDPTASVWTTSTDSKSLAAAGGSMNITTSGSLGLALNAVVTMYRTSDPTKRIQGTVTSNIGTNLQFTYTANGSTGTAGPFTDWTIGSNDLYFSEGIGVWHITPPATSGLGPGNYVSISAGIEQLVPRWIISPWGASACTTLGTATSVPIVTSEDRAVFVLSDQSVYPSQQQIGNNFAPYIVGVTPITHGWSADWSGNSPQSLVALIGNFGLPGWSNDCGATWDVYGHGGSTTLPDGFRFNGDGSIAIAATSTNHVVIQQANSDPGMFTLDGGVTWTQMSYPGVPSAGTLFTSASGISPLTFSSVPSWLSTGIASGAAYTFSDINTGAGGTVTGVSGNTVTTSGTSGTVAPGDKILFNVNMGFGGSLASQFLAADRVTDDVFYIHNGNVTSIGGFYKTTNGGATWTQECSVTASPTTCPTGSQNADQMRSVPGHTGEWWFTAGANNNSQGHPYAIGFYKCNTSSVVAAGTTTCTQPNPNVKEVWAFGFGKAKPGGSGYPAIFIYGWVTTFDPTNAAVYRSDDAGLTWTPVSCTTPSLACQFPNKNLDSVTTLEGDANIYGTFYVGFGGSGWATGTLH